LHFFVTAEYSDNCDADLRTGKGQDFTVH
jgi:hypothetical protein